MISTSVSFQTSIKADSRTFDSYVIVNGTTYQGDNIVHWKLDDRVSDGNEFMIGQTVANSFEITLTGVTGSFDGVSVVPYIGIEVSQSPSTFEYVSLGTFYVDNMEVEYDTITLHCFDRMMKFNKPYIPTITFPNTFTNILNDVCTQAGVPFSGTSPNFTVTTVPNGYSCREIVGFISAIDGSNAVINRSNNLIFKRFTNTATDIDLSLSGDDYFENGLKRQTGTYTIGRVKGIRKESPSTTFTNGTLPAGTRELTFVNLWVNQDIVDNVGSRLNGLTYIPFSMEWQGNPALESGDNLQIDEYRVDIFKTVALSNTLNFDGGLTCTTSCDLEGSIVNSGVESSRLDERLASAETSIEQTKTDITLKASISTVNALDSRVSSAEASINVNATAITQKVSATDYNGNTIASLINQSATTITLSASKIDLAGITKVYRELQIGETADVSPTLKFGGYNTWLIQDATRFTITSDDPIKLFSSDSIQMTNLSLINMTNSTVSFNGAVVDFTNAVIDFTGAFPTNLYAVFG